MKTLQILQLMFVSPVFRFCMYVVSEQGLKIVLDSCQSFYSSLVPTLHALYFPGRVQQNMLSYANGLFSFVLYHLYDTCTLQFLL